MIEQMCYDHQMKNEVTMLSKEIPKTPYPELPSVLERFVEGVRTVFQQNLIGIYLVGSIATGDFDADSDVDFFVIVEGELTEKQISMLNVLHSKIFELGNYPAMHLEGSYASQKILNTSELVGTSPLWYVDNGSTNLEQSVHDNQWHVRWILRERSITLTGPDAKTFIAPIPSGALKTEMYTSLQKLRSAYAEDLTKPKGWFRTKFGQSFTVLTCCRVLHTFESGKIESKLKAVEWSKKNLPQIWCELIRSAWLERNGVRFGKKIHEPASLLDLERTLQFVDYSLTKAQEHMLK